jgi:hypothetical protein
MDNAVIDGRDTHFAKPLIVSCVHTPSLLSGFLSKSSQVSLKIKRPEISFLVFKFEKTTKTKFVAKPSL